MTPQHTPTCICCDDNPDQPDDGEPDDYLDLLHSTPKTCGKG